MPFSDEEILKIRSDGRSAPEMAREMGCSASGIRQIRGGFTYLDAPWPPLEETPQWKGGKRGPRPECANRGEDNPPALLDASAVVWVRDEKERYPGKTLGTLAEEVTAHFDLPRVPAASTISAILNRRTWTHVD